MSITLETRLATAARPGPGPRASLIAIALIFAAAGFLATGAGQTAGMVELDGESLTRLMRAMAVIKFVLAFCAFAAIIWRLAAPVTAGWFAAYAAATTGMAAGPGLIWGMVHIIAGAILLHGGLLLAVLLLWRDPAVGAQLAALINRRRAALAR
jgi:hypothetical protein